MLLYHFDDVFKCLVVAFAVVALIIIYTFYANMRRSDDDPKKREYHPWAILLAPLTVPFFFSLAVAAFILTAVLFMGFLIFFGLSLVAIRKWFIFSWWHKFATMIGDPLLSLSTSLLRLPFNMGRERSQSLPQESPLNL